ncbi:hypothetical protein [Brevundimonas naejangsanensis]|uniref:hypothetical protein n=1 Tax=Brevundimonas naejangsanensis TaxID=588932 RepID=UPI003265E2AB
MGAAGGTFAREGNRLAVAAGVRVQLVSGDRRMMAAVKFMSHNDLGIYLHDTPWPSLRAAQRALSAGAVRREDAPSDNGLQVETVQKRVDSSAEQPVDLSEPVLLYLLYLTARLLSAAG